MISKEKVEALIAKWELHAESIKSIVEIYGEHVDRCELWRLNDCINDLKVLLE